MKRGLGQRTLAFVVLAAASAFTILAAAQPSKGGGAKPRAPAVTPGRRPVPATKARDAGSDAAAETEAESTATREATRDGGASGGGVVQATTLDGGGRVFRFGEVEVEGRLKSPQIVYFLRRVRAEFAAGDLGHRTFVRELSETRNEPGF